MAVVTFAEAVSYLGVTGTSRLETIVDGINDWVETECGRNFDLAVYSEVIRIQPYQTEFSLSNYPLDSMISLVDASSVIVDIYAMDEPKGIIQIKASFWSSFPTIVKDPELLTVRYQAGYSAMPTDLKLAVFSVIEEAHYMRDTSIVQERLGDRSYRKAIDGIPSRAKETIELYAKKD